MDQQFAIPYKEAEKWSQMLKVYMKEWSFCTEYNQYRTLWTTEHSSGQEVGNIFKGFRQAK